MKKAFQILVATVVVVGFISACTPSQFQPVAPWGGYGLQNWNGPIDAYDWCNMYMGPMYPTAQFIPIQYGYNFQCIPTPGNPYDFNQFNHYYGFNPWVTGVSTAYPYLQGCMMGGVDLDGDGIPACNCQSFSTSLWPWFSFGANYGICTDI